MKKELPSKRMEEIAETVEDMAQYKEDLYEREELKEETLQLVVFRLAREWYGVEITKVKEVIKVGKITYLPSSPEHIAGIVNLRGNILSVTDLKTIFSLPHEEPTEKARIIAIESGVLETGFLVDEVVESIEVPVSKIEPALLTLPAEGGKYIEGQCKVDNKLVALISVEEVLEKRV
ncbi:MAG: chemotaxis protein CheW [Deltaproteobacteria bacterium CG03_land_8_20_14_0_80_45_14]|nr:MAG: chemotaxis protein CheW [Deltaproteobacteria bacterium CG03_land_8_20_14_0_80_45_14]